MPLALIEMLGLQPRPTDPNAPTPPNGARSGGRRGDQTGNGGAHSLQPQVAMRLGHGPGLTKVGLAAGNLQASSSRLGNSQSGFEAAADAHGGALFPGPPGSRWTHMTQSINHGEVSTGGPREAKRTRAQRGNNRGKGMQESGFQAASRQQVEGRPRSLEPLTDGRFVEDLNALPCFELMTPNPESDCAANLDRFRYVLYYCVYAAFLGLCTWFPSPDCHLCRTSVMCRIFSAVVSTPSPRCKFQLKFMP